MIYDTDTPSDSAFFGAVAKVGVLLYFLIGASRGETLIPGRYISSDWHTISGSGAWLVCLFPAVWLAGDLVWYVGFPGLGKDQRRVLARSLAFIGFGTFFVAMVI